MRTDKLIVVFRKLKATYLRSNLELVYFFVFFGVPEFDAHVSGSAASEEKSVLMRGPFQSFYSCFMILIRMLCLVRLNVPDLHQVIITSRCQLLTVW